MRKFLIFLLLIACEPSAGAESEIDKTWDTDRCVRYKIVMFEDYEIEEITTVINDFNAEMRKCSNLCLEPNDKADLIIVRGDGTPEKQMGLSRIEWDNEHIRKGAVYLDLFDYSVILHELFHSVGLSHNDDVDDIMYPEYSIGDFRRYDRAYLEVCDYYR